MIWMKSHYECGVKGSPQERTAKLGKKEHLLDARASLPLILGKL